MPALTDEVVNFLTDGTNFSDGLDTFNKVCMATLTRQQIYSVSDRSVLSGG